MDTRSLSYRSCGLFGTEMTRVASRALLKPIGWAPQRRAFEVVPPEDHQAFAGNMRLSL